MIQEDIENSSAHKQRRLTLFQAAIAALLIGSLVAIISPLSASPAFATVGCEGNDGGTPHCYSIMQILQGQWTGIWGTWHRNNLQSGGSTASQPNHINSEMWFTLTNGAYLESGLYDGFEPSTYGNGCNCGAYAQFWADTDSNGNQFTHVIANVSPTGQTDTYQISRAPNVNQWYIFLNGNNVGLSTITQAWSGPRMDIGGELQAPSDTNPSGSHADDFDMYAKVINGNGQAVNWPEIDRRYLSESPPFQGISYSLNPTEWSWQKQ